MEEKKHFSNGTMEEVRETLQQKNKEKKCPVCGSIRERERFMTQLENSLTEFIRKNDLAQRESCLFCVKKHVGKALVLFREIQSCDPAGNTQGKGRIRVLLNHLEIIGNLQAAADEAAQYKDLRELLFRSERDYRYEGRTPDWDKIALLTAKQEGESV